MHIHKINLVVASVILGITYSSFAQHVDTTGMGEYQKVRNARNLSERLTMFKQWQSRSPESSASNFYYYDQAKIDIAMSYTKEKKIPEAEAYLSSIKLNSMRPLGHANVTKLLLADSNYVAAARVITPIADTLTLFPGISPSVYHQIYGLYAYSQYELGKYSEVVTKLKDVWINSNMQDNFINKYYPLALFQTGRYQDAMLVFSNLLTSGRVCAEVMDKFEMAYLRTKGHRTGYARYIDSLRTILKKNLKAGLRSRLVKEKIADFSLKDLEGKTVTLSSLKGSIVIIDYWSTTCGPCLRAFPGLNAAVLKYKNRQDIVFLFINEHPDPYEKRKQDLQAFMKAKKYQFRVLLDENDASHPNGRVAKTQKVKALPSKFVIDREGYLRFQITGYPDDETAIVEEISAMIEMI